MKGWYAKGLTFDYERLMLVGHHYVSHNHKLWGQWLATHWFLGELVVFLEVPSKYVWVKECFKQ